MTVTTTGTSTGHHPLAALTAEEIQAATAIVRADPRWTDSWRFAYVGLEAAGQGRRALVQIGRSGRSARSGCRSWPGPRPT